MFLVLLAFADRNRAGMFAEEHNKWLARGFADGVFLLSGSVRTEPGGGAILAHGVSAAELRRHIDEDPFVVEGVVTATIVEVAPSRADERLTFLVDVA